MRKGSRDVHVFAFPSSLSEGFWWLSGDACEASSYLVAINKSLCLSFCSLQFNSWPGRHLRKPRVSHHGCPASSPEVLTAESICSESCWPHLPGTFVPNIITRGKQLRAPGLQKQSEGEAGKPAKVLTRCFYTRSASLSSGAAPSWDISNLCRLILAFSLICKWGMPVVRLEESCHVYCDRFNGCVWIVHSMCFQEHVLSLFRQ